MEAQTTQPQSELLTLVTRVSEQQAAIAALQIELGQVKARNHELEQAMVSDVLAAVKGGTRPQAAPSNTQQVLQQQPGAFQSQQLTTNWGPRKAQCLAGIRQACLQGQGPEDLQDYRSRSETVGLQTYDQSGTAVPNLGNYLGWCMDLTNPRRPGGDGRSHVVLTPEDLALLESQGGAYADYVALYKEMAAVSQQRSFQSAAPHPAAAPGAGAPTAPSAPAAQPPMAPVTGNGVPF